ncbi:hypothetical protein CL628_00085 [bacterium]|nr:hypothetical protein [bacterium]
MDEIGSQEWDAQVTATPGGSFLQSWGWGELQRELGNTFWRLREKDGLALVIKRPLRFGKNWLYSPRGPITASPATFATLVAQMEKLAEVEQSLFIRTEPATKLEQPWRKAPKDTQPARTLVLDLTKTQDELLAAMHQKSRYNIRLAERKGVTVRFSKDEADIEHFLTLAKEVAGRAPFTYHPPDYYRTFMRVLDHHGAQLAIAEHKNKVLAVHILMTFGDTVTYVHGASSVEQRSLMAPHLLQWESIKHAQVGSATRYDFYGIAPADAGPEHSWTGITRFKLGFSGKQISYPGSYDLVRNRPWYWLYTAAHR